jgi:methylenetetrahydrofolate dehydrogenase (NADP+)/methenyltetrahydrofolate cyclohydrolase
VQAICWQKDVDGLTAVSQGKLFLGMEGLRPCTPLGVIDLIEYAGWDIAGLHAVVLGRSILVGSPVGRLLLEKDATVTMAHSKTVNVPSLCRTADILVVAAGKPGLVKGDWIRPGAIVIDVGIHRGPNGLVGDVDFASAHEIAGAITPVPGGVGPMTIAKLLENCLKAYKLRKSPNKA